MSPRSLEQNITRWLRAQDNWPGALSESEQEYINDVIALVSGFALAAPIGPCPRACRPYLAAMVHACLVPLALPVTMELELACEDQDP